MRGCAVGSLAALGGKLTSVTSEKVPVCFLRGTVKFGSLASLLLLVAWSV